jgi:antitoxin component YwqK of YwqJK toxin-antitoxin module
MKYYYYTGGLSEELPYVNGEKHGTSRWFYRSGALKRVTVYATGKKRGVANWYQESGALVVFPMGTLNPEDSCPMNGCPTENFV